MTGHPMGPSGRELVAFASQLAPAPVPPGDRRTPSGGRVTAAGGQRGGRASAPTGRMATGSSSAGSGRSGTHGVLPEERARAQPFEVDLDLAVDLAPAAASDRLSDTVDYAAVAETRGRGRVGSASFQLLEALAGAVAEAVLASTPGSPR